jgi:ubiquinone/menaquinone biosynthesis C-methylase UbiE
MQQIKDQYQSSKNLETRMGMYRFGTNPQNFRDWQVEYIESGEDLSILELGCGTGDLWTKLKNKFRNCQIILSDLSEGMIEKSRAALGTENFEYRKIDFHSLPFEPDRFDIVISNHNLYHADDFNQVLAEIQRVLKPGGKFYATTNSSRHLSEFRDLLQIEEDHLWPNSLITSEFGAESAGEKLKDFFSNIQCHFHENELRITDFEAIKSYFLSVRDERMHKRVTELSDQIQQIVEEDIKTKGYFSANTRACMFVCEGK